VRSTDLYRELLDQVRSRFVPQPDKTEESPESTLDALWLRAAGRPFSARRAPAEALGALDAGQVSTLRSLVEQRLAGTPLAHLTGRQHFMGLELLAGPDALVPRIETEILARAAISAAEEIGADVATPRILDVCTGSGNIALVLASRIARALVGACDLSESAVELARRNAGQLGLSARIDFRAGDLLVPFRDTDWTGSVDLLTCNPPYISSSKVPAMADEIAHHEPSMAFDGGPFGVSILMRLIQEAPDMLRSGGWLAFEVGLGQGPAMEKKLRTDSRFSTVRSHHDSDGKIRAITVQRV